MKIGIIPAPGSGLESMHRTGQLERLFVHLGHYANTCSQLRYMTWGNMATESALWRPFAEQTHAQLVPAARRWQALRDCDVLRCLNLAATLAALPILRPFVFSYGADYPAIARIHGRPAWKWKALRAVAIRRASCVLVPNRMLAETLLRRYPDRPIIYHPNWVDCERFAPITDAPRGSARTVLFVGRLVKEKNLERLAEAVVAIPTTRLICVGAGPLGELLSTLGAHCVGPQPWTTLPRWYHSADVFALPSLSEGHPKALSEAMACGLPCVVSFAVTDGGGAVRRSADSTLADTLRDFLNTPMLARQYSDAARAYALAHWDVRHLMPREIGYVREAAGYVPPANGLSRRNMIHPSRNRRIAPARASEEGGPSESSGS